MAEQSDKGRRITNRPLGPGAVPRISLRHGKPQVPGGNVPEHTARMLAWKAGLIKG